MEQLVGATQPPPLPPPTPTPTPTNTSAPLGHQLRLQRVRVGVLLQQQRVPALQQQVQRHIQGIRGAAGYGHLHGGGRGLQARGEGVQLRAEGLVAVELFFGGWGWGLGGRVQGLGFGGRVVCVVCGAPLCAQAAAALPCTPINPPSFQHHNQTQPTQPNQPKHSPQRTAKEYC